MCAMSEESAKYTYEQAVDRASHMWYAESTFNAFRVAENRNTANTVSVIPDKKELNRPKALQDLVFAGFDQMPIPNILTVKPGMKLDYKFFRS